MSWNYRIVRTSGEGPLRPWEMLGLYEVHYDSDGNPNGRTKDLASFACDARLGTDGIVKALEMALSAARKYPVLSDGDFVDRKRDGGSA